MTEANFTLSMVDKVSAAANAATSALNRMGDATHKTQGHLDHASEQMEKLGEAFGFVGEPGEKVEGLMGKLQQLGPMLEDPYTVGAVAAAAYAAAIAYATEKVGELILEGMKFSLEASEEETRYHALFDALGDYEGAGEEVSSMLEGLRDVTGMTKAQMVPFAEQLMAMGISSENLAGHIQAIAVAQKLGMGGAEVYTGILSRLTGGMAISSKQLKELYKTGVSFQEVAKGMGMTTKQLEDQLKLGGDVAKKFGQALEGDLLAKAPKLETLTNSMSSQVAIIKEKFGDLFEDVEVAPFLESMKGVGKVFDKNSAAGHAMNVLITSVFSNLFKQASKLIPWLIIQFKKLIIAVLEFAIFVKKNWKTIETVFKVLGIIVLGLAVIIGVVLVAAAALCLITFVALGAVFAIVGVAIYMVYVQAMVLYDWLGKIVDKLGTWGDAAKKAALDFIMGLVNGISSGTEQVTKTVANLGGAATGALKKALDAHSPSRKAHALGKAFGQGFVGGVQDMNAPALKAGSGIGSSALGGTSSASPNIGGGGMGITVQIAPGAVVVQVSGGNVAEIEEMLEEKIAIIFERAALAQGLGSG